MDLTQNEIRELIFNTIHQWPIDTFDEWIGIKRDDNTSKYTYSVVVTDENHFEIDVRYDGGRVLVIEYEVFIPMKAVIPMHRITFDVVREFFGSAYFMHYDGIRIIHDDCSLSIDQETKIAASNIPHLYDLVCNIFDVLRDESERKSKIMHDASVTKSIPGLTTKEVFVLDTSYFVIGDIYLLEIDHIYDWSKISSTPVKIPRQVYAICGDVCSTVIEFMIGGIEGRDSLFRIPVHADEIESGLITVKRTLSNESLIQNTTDYSVERYGG